MSTCHYFLFHSIALFLMLLAGAFASPLRPLQRLIEFDSSIPFQFHIVFDLQLINLANDELERLTIIKKYVVVVVSRSGDVGISPFLFRV